VAKSCTEARQAGVELHPPEKLQKVFGQRKRHPYRHPLQWRYWCHQGWRDQVRSETKTNITFTVEEDEEGSHVRYEIEGGGKVIETVITRQNELAFFDFVKEFNEESNKNKSKLPHLHLETITKPRGRKSTLKCIKLNFQSKRGNSISKFASRMSRMSIVSKKSKKSKVSGKSVTSSVSKTSDISIEKLDSERYSTSFL